MKFQGKSNVRCGYVWDGSPLKITSHRIQLTNESMEQSLNRCKAIQRKPIGSIVLNCYQIELKQPWLVNAQFAFWTMINLRLAQITNNNNQKSDLRTTLFSINENKGPKLLSKYSLTWNWMKWNSILVENRYFLFNHLYFNLKRNSFTFFASFFLCFQANIHESSSTTQGWKWYHEWKRTNGR